MDSLKVPGVLASQPGLRVGLRRTRQSLHDGAGHCYLAELMHDVGRLALTW
jgi:hypothetical protein